MARGKKQQVLDAPGMMAKNIAELEDAASKWRGLVSERMDLQEQEAAAKAALIDEIHKQIAAGAITLPVKSDTELVPIYRYRDDDDIERVIQWGRKESVKVGKVKEAAADAEAL